jgi:hypothetical protein
MWPAMFFLANLLAYPQLKKLTDAKEARGNTREASEVDESIFLLLKFFKIGPLHYTQIRIFHFKLRFYSFLKYIVEYILIFFAHL